MAERYPFDIAGLSGNLLEEYLNNLEEDSIKRELFLFLSSGYERELLSYIEKHKPNLSLFPSSIQIQVIKNMKDEKEYKKAVSILLQEPGNFTPLVKGLIEEKKEQRLLDLFETREPDIRVFIDLARSNGLYLSWLMSYMENHTLDIRVYYNILRVLKTKGDLPSVYKMLSKLERDLDYIAELDVSEGTLLPLLQEYGVNISKVLANNIERYGKILEFPIEERPRILIGVLKELKSLNRYVLTDYFQLVYNSGVSQRVYKRLSDDSKLWNELTKIIPASQIRDILGL